MTDEGGGLKDKIKNLKKKRRRQNLFLAISVFVVGVVLLLIFFGDRIFKSPGEVVAPGNTPGGDEIIIGEDGEQQSASEGEEESSIEGVWGEDGLLTASAGDSSAQDYLGDGELTPEEVYDMLYQAENQIALYTQQLNQYQSEVNYYSSQVAELQSQVEALATQINNLSPQADNYQAQLEALQEQIDSLMVQIDSYLEIIAEIQEQIDYVIEQINHFIEVYDYILSQIDELDPAFAWALEQFNFLNSQIDALAGQITALNSQIEDLQISVEELPQLLEYIAGILLNIPQSFNRINQLMGTISQISLNISSDFRDYMYDNISNVIVRILEEESWYDPATEKGRIVGEVDLRKYADSVKLGLYYYDYETDMPNVVYNGEFYEIKPEGWKKNFGPGGGDLWKKIKAIEAEPAVLKQRMESVARAIYSYGADPYATSEYLSGWYYDVTPRWAGIQRSSDYETEEECVATMKSLYENEFVEDYDYYKEDLDNGVYGCFKDELDFSETNGYEYYFDKNLLTGGIQKSKSYLTRGECLQDLVNVYRSKYEMEDMSEFVRSEFAKNEAGEDSIFGCFENTGSNKFYFDRNPSKDGIQKSKKFPQKNICYANLVQHYELKYYAGSDYEKDELDKNRNGEDSIYGCFESGQVEPNEVILEIQELKNLFRELNDALVNYDYRDQEARIQELLDELEGAVYKFEIPVKNMPYSGMFAFHFEPFDINAVTNTTTSTETVTAVNEAPTYYYDTDPHVAGLQKSDPYDDKDECNADAVAFYFANGYLQGESLEASGSLVCVEIYEEVELQFDVTTVGRVLNVNSLKPPKMVLRDAESQVYTFDVGGVAGAGGNFNSLEECEEVATEEIMGAGAAAELGGVLNACYPAFSSIYDEFGLAYGPRAAASLPRAQVKWYFVKNYDPLEESDLYPTESECLSKAESYFRGLNPLFDESGASVVCYKKIVSADEIVADLGLEDLDIAITEFEFDEEGKKLFIRGTVSPDAPLGYEVPLYVNWGVIPTDLSNISGKAWYFVKSGGQKSDYYSGLTACVVDRDNYYNVNDSDDEELVNRVFAGEFGCFRDEGVSVDTLSQDRNSFLIYSGPKPFYIAGLGGSDEGDWEIVLPGYGTNTVMSASPDADIKPGRVYGFRIITVAEDELTGEDIVVPLTTYREVGVDFLGDGGASGLALGGGGVQGDLSLDEIDTIIRCGYDTNNDGIVGVGEMCDYNDLIGLINKAIKLFLNVFLVPLLAGVLLYVGFIYMKDSDKPDKIKKVKGMLKNVGIGLLIIVFAYTFVLIFLRFFGIGAPEWYHLVKSPNSSEVEERGPFGSSEECESSIYGSEASGYIVEGGCYKKNQTNMNLLE